MANLTQAIRTYSYIDRAPIDLGTADLSDSDVALLAQIDALLTAAAASFNARGYDAAISQYHGTESLIYAHLDPQWVPDLGTKFHLVLPRDPSLFDSLLSASSQWLNILPVPTPPSPVRPATAPNPQLLASVASFHGAGLTPVSSNLGSTTAAIADMKLATIYAGQGNTVASTALITRAQGLDPTVATQIAAANGLSITSPAPTESTQAPSPPVLSLAPKLTLTASPKLATTVSSSLHLQNLPIDQFPTLPISVLPRRQVGLITGTGTSFSVKTVQWAANSSPDIASIKSNLYAPHITAASLPDALTNAVSLWERAALLPHYYYYVIPLALAECYQAMGDYANAEICYLQAAGYAYINTAIEGPYVWVRLASLYCDWGNSVYKQGDTVTAATIYGNVLLPGSPTAPSAPLYTLTGLATAANIAKTLIPQLATLATNGVSGLNADDTSIASVLLQIYAKGIQINGGLDYWGNYSATTPIWTFSYLQQVAINFAQLALGAEQNMVNYWSQADQATLTSTELTNQAAQANGQVSAAQQQLTVAKDQAQTYQDAATLAQTRSTDASQSASEYALTNSHAIVLQAMAGMVSSGDVSDANSFNLTEGDFNVGDMIDQSPGVQGPASLQFQADRFSQEYQVDSLDRTKKEMQQALTQAQDELKAANAQVTAANVNLGVASLEATGAAQTLGVFNSDIFSPQLWRAMGDFVEAIYERYLDMALRAAKSMQQAYNFENDTTLNYIKNSYQGVEEDLLAADSLMADIQSFTDDLVSSTRGKKQLVKIAISLATNYGYLFETQLRKTGTMAFETTLDDFDSVFPGSYQGRIRSVTVDVQGIVPPSGISGSLTNGGISVYRLPSDTATSTTSSKIRLQNSDTLVLSDYNPTQDGLLDSSDGNQMGIFEGAGVASSWTLSLPRSLNDIDYGTLTDVVLTFLYETRYDPQLVPTVLAQLAGRPGYYDRERSIPLAWLYPDLFYAFAGTGTLTLTLAVADFPLNQTLPIVTAVSLLVAMTTGTSAQGITISLTAPGKTSLSGVTDSSGTISSQGTGSSWAGVTGGTALGIWTINLTAAGNPALAPGGKLNLSALINLVLVLDYSFTPRT